MLCGPCLHGLPGWGHGATLSSSHDADHVREAGKVAHVQADNCPVCHFFSQGQLPVDLAMAPAGRQVCVLKLPTHTEIVRLTLRRTSSPRAPPALA